MAKKVRNEIAVGITVITVLVLTFCIVLALADWPDAYASKQNITVQLPYKMGLRGLKKGSPVYLGGAKIGQVTNTRIEKLDPNSTGDEDVWVFFTIKIPQKYPLRRDCVLMPESNVLGGQTILAITDLGCRETLVQDGQTIKLTLADSMTEAIKREFNPDNPDSLVAHLKFEVDRDNDDSIMASVAHSANNLKQLTAKIDRQFTLDDQKQTLMVKVHSILDRLGDVTEQINTQFDTDNKMAVLARLNIALDKLDAGLTQIKEMIETNKTDVTQMVTSLKNTAEQLENDLPTITKQIEQSLAKADASIDTAQVALTNLKDFSSQASDTIQVNRDNIDQLIRNVAEVSVNLKLASRDVHRAPWKLLYKPKQGELKIQGLIDSAGDFAAGAERLDNASLRLKTILETTGEKIPVDKKKIDAIITELETSFEKFEKAEQKFWKEL